MLFATDAVGRALSMWRTDGVLDQVHATPFGELPGLVVILFPTVDAAVHAWGTCRPASGACLSSRPRWSRR